MSQKTKRTIFITGAALIFLTLVGLILSLVFFKNTLDETKLSLAEKEDILKTNTRLCFVASRDITANEKLILDGDNANIFTQNVYSGVEEGFYLSKEDLINSPVALVDIPKNTPIQTNMASIKDFSKDTRDVEIAVCNIMTTQKDFDYVDIRILFPNGEDYTVLSKKLVENLDFDNCIFTSTLNEEEILRLSSATIDAFTISGAYIYSTRYVEGSIQEASKPDYLVKEETIQLLSTNPNVLSLAKETVNAKARRDLEIRLSKLTEDQLDAVTEGFSLFDTAKGAVLTKIAKENAEIESLNDGLYIDYEDGSEGKEDLTSMTNGKIEDKESKEE